jgi:hypothetical protein
MSPELWIGAHRLSAPPLPTRASLAAQCRSAGLAFLDGTAGPWGKRDLASWLSGAYAEAVAHTGRRVSARSRRPHGEHVEPVEVDALLRDARWTVLGELEAASLPHGRPGFVVDVLDRGGLAPVRAADGVAWVPLDVEGLRLRTRVLSLFAADALDRPLDYACSLQVCHRCERVTFGDPCQHRGA